MLKRALAVFITAGIFSGLISAPAHALINRDVRCSGGGFFRITQSVVEAKTSAENTVAANKCVGTAVVPVGVTAIGAQAFNGESLMTSIVLPDTITTIGGNGLASTGLTSVNLPANLTRLGQGALFDNGSLTSLVIPASVTAIDQYVLFNSANLCNVYFLGTRAPIAAPFAFAAICSGGTAKGWVPNGASLYPLPGQDFRGLQINSGAAIILFDSNGATDGSVPATEVVIIGSTFTFPSKGSLDRTNSSFLGWCTTKLDEGAGNCYIPGNTLVAPEGTTIVYANWQGDPKVTYNGNGNTAGSAPVDSNSPYEKNSSVTVAGSAGSLEKTGYTFDGWNTQSDGLGTPYPASGSFTIGDASVTLYAQWKIAQYSVTYNANGSTSGTVPVDSGSPFDYNTSITVLGSGTLERTGYDFAGWNTNAQGTGTDRAENSTFTIGAANVSLFAKWTVKTYSVTYDANGSTAGSVPTDGSSPYNYNTSVIVAGNTGNLDRTGYDFAGWNTNDQGTGTNRAASSNFTIGTSNVTLYAKWNIKSFNVTYDANGSTGGSVPVDVASPRNYNTSATVLGNTGSLEKSGYVFMGWNTAADGSGTKRLADSTFNVPAADVVLYALWSNSGTLTYDGNGNSGGAVPVDGGSPHNFGSTITVSASSGSLSKTGYKFVGWNTAANGTGTSYSSTGVTTFVMPEFDVTLFAVWELVPAVVKSVEKDSTSSVEIKIRFPFGSSTLSKANRKALEQIVANSGAGTTYRVIGGVGDQAGVTTRHEKQLAKNRCKSITSYLAKLEVPKSNITITSKVFRIGVIPKTLIISKFLLSD